MGRYAPRTKSIAGVVVLVFVIEALAFVADQVRTLIVVERERLYGDYRETDEHDRPARWA